MDYYLRNQRHALAVMLTAWTGLRPSELKIRVIIPVNEEQNQIKIRVAKVTSYSGQPWWTI